jgi:hypothetical protein
VRDGFTRPVGDASPSRATETTSTSAVQGCQLAIAVSIIG